MIKDKEMTGRYFCSSLFLAFTIGIYAPLSIYCANADEYWYSLGMIWYIPVLTFVVILVGSTLLSVILPKPFGNIWNGFVFGIGSCFYLQGNFLKLQAGIFDGAFIDWDSFRVRFVYNLLIWIIVIVVSMIIAGFDKVSKIMKWISLFLTAIQLVSLVVLVIPVLQKDGMETSKRPSFTAEGLYEVGDDNIIVICLDALDEEYIDHIIREEPELRSILDGFEFYDNFTSSYRSTAWSFPSSFVFGKEYHNEMPRMEWIEEKAKERLYFDELNDNGYDVSLYTEMISCFPERVQKSADNYEELDYRFDNFRTCFATLYKIAGCVYFPDIVKPYIWMDDTVIRNTAKWDDSIEVFRDSNGLFKENLQKNGINVKKGAKQFKFIHLRGTHEPYYTDENGDETGQHWDWQIAMKGCMRILDAYFGDLKKQGVYDDSVIIVTGDHGYHLTPGVISNPAFLFKPKGANGEVKVNSNEAGLINLAATIADLAGAKDTSQYGISILDIDEDTEFDRFFYSFVCNADGTKNTSCLLEYITPVDTNDVTQFKLTGYEYTQDGERIVHKDYCSTCLEGVAPEVLDKWHIVDRHCHTADYPYSSTDLK